MEQMKDFLLPDKEHGHSCPWRTSLQRQECRCSLSRQPWASRLLSSPFPGSRDFSRGFSILELLVVIAILAILMVMTVPSMGSLLDTNNVTRAGQMINDQIAMARQLASTRGQSVQVRFYKPDGTNFTAMQVMGGAGYSNALSKPALFPDNFALNAGMSPMLTALTYTTNSGTASIRGKVNADASFFLIRASGAVEPDLGTNNYITVANTRRNPPVNYATIQVDPDSARTSIYRP